MTNIALGNFGVQAKGAEFNLKDLRLNAPFRLGTITDVETLSQRAQANQDNLMTGLNRILTSLDTTFNTLKGQLQSSTRPYIRLRQSASSSQTIGHNTWTSVEWDEILETSGTPSMFETSADLRITIQRTGIYFIFFNANLAAAAGQVRRLRVLHNGTTAIVRAGGTIDTFTAGGSSGYSISTTIKLSAGDYIEGQFLQADASSGAQALNHTTGHPLFGVYMISEVAAK